MAISKTQQSPASGLTTRIGDLPPSVVRVATPVVAPPSEKEVARENLTAAQQAFVGVVGSPDQAATAAASQALTDAKQAFMTAVSEDVMARAETIGRGAIPVATARAAAERLATRSLFEANKNAPLGAPVTAALKQSDAQIDAVYDAGLRELTNAGAEPAYRQAISASRDASKLTAHVAAGDVPGASALVESYLKKSLSLDGAMLDPATVTAMAQAASGLKNPKALADARTLTQKMLASSPDDAKVKDAARLVQLLVDISAGTPAGDAAAQAAIKAFDKGGVSPELRNDVNLARIALLEQRGLGDLKQTEAALKGALSAWGSKEERVTALTAQFDFIDVGLQKVKGFADRPGVKQSMLSLLTELGIKPGKNPFDPAILRAAGVKLIELERR